MDLALMSPAAEELLAKIFALRKQLAALEEAQSSVRKAVTSHHTFLSATALALTVIYMGVFALIACLYRQSRRTAQAAQAAQVHTTLVGRSAIHPVLNAAQAPQVATATAHPGPGGVSPAPALDDEADDYDYSSSSDHEN